MGGGVYGMDVCIRSELVVLRVSRSFSKRGIRIQSVCSIHWQKKKKKKKSSGLSEKDPFGIMVLQYYNFQLLLFFFFFFFLLSFCSDLIEMIDRVHGIFLAFRSFYPRKIWDLCLPDFSSPPNPLSLNGVGALIGSSIATFDHEDLRRFFPLLFSIDL